ncbi:MAG: hypothetical protein U0992_13875 [Planctomycetaceae bacterium]
MSTLANQQSGSATAMAENGGISVAERRNARLTFVFTIVLALLILIPSMLGFIAKFIELFAVLNGEPDGVFALTPILNYLLASLGFFCLLLWAAGRGMFHDVELPKRAMLEREDLLDGRIPGSTSNS